MLNFFLRNRFSHVEAAAEGTRLSHGALATVMSVILMIAASLVGTIIAAAIFAVINPNAIAALQSGNMGALSAGQLGLILFLGNVFVFATFWLWLKFWEKRAFPSIGFRGGQGLFRFARGAAFGLVAMAGIAVILWTTGNMELAAQTPLSASWLVGPAALLLVGGGWCRGRPKK